MDEQQVDVVSLQLAQAFVDAPGCFLLAGVANPHFRHQENVLAPDTALGNGGTHSLFVLIGLCRVNQPVAHFERIAYTALSLLWWHQKNTIAQQGHFNSVR